MKKINYNDHGLKIFIHYLLSEKRLFVIDMICALLMAVVDLVFPYVTRISMNRLLPQQMFKAFFAVMLIMALAYVMKNALFYIVTVLGHRMGVLVESDMRRDIFTHMQDLSCSFYDKNRTGVLMSRITTELFDITELAHHGPENLLICTLTIVGALIMMFTMKWQLALVLTLIIPL